MLATLLTSLKSRMIRPCEHGRRRRILPSNLVTLIRRHTSDVIGFAYRQYPTALNNKDSISVFVQLYVSKISMNCFNSSHTESSNLNLVLNLRRMNSELGTSPTVWPHRMKFLIFSVISKSVTVAIVVCATWLSWSITGGLIIIFAAVDAMSSWGSIFRRYSATSLQVAELGIPSKSTFWGSVQWIKLRSPRRSKSDFRQITVSSVFCDSGDSEQQHASKQIDLIWFDLANDRPVAETLVPIHLWMWSG